MQQSCLPQAVSTVNVLAVLHALVLVTALVPLPQLSFLCLPHLLIAHRTIGLKRGIYQHTAGSPGAGTSSHTDVEFTLSSDLLGSKL